MHIDAALQQHHWEILCTDLPALDPSHLAPGDHMVHLVEALHIEQAAAHQEQADACTHAAAPKQLTDVFPQMAEIWQCYCGVLTNLELPPIYHAWANATKAEWCMMLQGAFTAHVNSSLWVAHVALLATKELCELLSQA